jgi:hypothetical protein
MVEQMCTSTVFGVNTLAERAAENKGRIYFGRGDSVTVDVSFDRVIVIVLRY